MQKSHIFIPLMLALGFLQSCSTQSEENNKINSDLISNSATASSEVDLENVPSFEFENELHDFGSITQGEKVSYSFKFKNTGKKNLIISSANGSCGCTVPQYPKNPIAPGESASIDVVFNSEGKEGKQDKSVTLMANTNPASKVLKISGNVIVPTSNNN